VEELVLFGLVVVVLVVLVGVDVDLVVVARLAFIVAM
jgi:hypothetical protein